MSKAYLWPRSRINVRQEEIRLDLGCGNGKRDGYVGLDFQDFGQEIVWDATLGVPLPDNSVIDLFSSHFVEHLDADQINIVFWEIQRICRNGTIVEIRCPHKDSTEAYDIAHYSIWDEKRFKGLINSQKNDILSIERNGIEIICKYLIKK